MANMISLEDLKARLESLKQEEEALERLIAVYEGQPIDNSSIPKVPYKSITTSFSVAGRLVDSIVELIHQKGRQVSSKEILEYINEKGVSLGDTKNKPGTLAAILSQEVAKKGTARLRKVARGVFDLKQ
ncbi:MAG: hypothetical protein HYR76_07075 [Ignavibacteria bacterium]|nr:hypothetical protein [Ignavibacteria bacterium]MBI3766327.1 hypothetical protein [Ignavibacteriales bacterium]